jgi:hypothetical protein
VKARHISLAISHGCSTILLLGMIKYAIGPRLHDSEKGVPAMAIGMMSRTRNEERASHVT